MKIFRIALPVTLACLLLLASAALAGEKKAPSATITLETTSIALGVGVSWGRGVLTYQGKEYPVSVNGLSLADLGVTSVTASGRVYDLNKLEDFAGEYRGTQLGWAAAGGTADLTLKNQNDVFIVLNATQKGVRLTMALEGVSFSLR